MIPSLLITLREVIEASLIIATILGILTKLGHRKSIRTTWIATGTAVGVSICILMLGSLLGVRVREFYQGKVETAVEGIFMILSAFFITWAVFFLHTYFGHKKVTLLKRVKETLEKEEQEGIFMLVFSAVFREGFEIVLFLSTVYFSASPVQILSGFGLGLLLGLLISFSLFSATLKLPVYYAFRITSGFLIVFAAGLLARGAGEFIELNTIGIFRQLPEISFNFIPNPSTLMGHMIQIIFGISRSMHIVSLLLYFVYIIYMSWWVFYRQQKSEKYSRVTK